MAANPYTTNLELQLDARDITGLSDGDAVATWTDSSAAGNDMTQATSGRRPVYKTNIIGSNPVVRFATTNDKSLYMNFASSWSGYSGVTIFALAQYNEANAIDYSGFLSMHPGSGLDYNSTSAFCFQFGHGYPYLRAALGLYYTAPTATPLGWLGIGEPSLFGFSLQQGTNGFKVISELGASTGIDSINIAGTPTGIVLGNRYLSGVATTNGSRFDIAMLLVYKEYMSDSNIETVSAWIADEFNLIPASGGGLIKAGNMNGGMQ